MASDTALAVVGDRCSAQLATVQRHALGVIRVPSIGDVEDPIGIGCAEVGIVESIEKECAIEGEYPVVGLQAPWAPRSALIVPKPCKATGVPPSMPK